MPFPAHLKEEVLVRAARSCCVCHQPKGTRIEVHHLIPDADGGPDTIENAIPLCYDCHHDAGHYNDRQPRGNKLRVNELRHHRDTWYDIISEHRVVPGEGPTLSCQYVVVSDLSVIADLVTANAKALPLVQAVLFAPNVAVDGFLRNELVKLQRGFNLGADTQRYRCPPTIDDYISEHPDTAVRSADEAVRPLSFEFLAEIGAPQLDFINNAVVAGSQLEELGEIAVHVGDCGSDAAWEEWVLPEFVGLWALLTNVSTEPVTLRSLGGVLEDCDTHSPRCLIAGNVPGADYELDMPPVPVLPNQAVLLPIAAAYALQGAVHLYGQPMRSESIGPGAYQQFATADYGPVLNRSWIVGPSFWPRTVAYMQGGRQGEEELRPLNPGHTYTVRRGLEYGSCPHLFVRNAYGVCWEYVGPILVGAHGVVRAEQVRLPIGTTEVRIIELEAETTTLVSVEVGEVRFNDVRLGPGDSLTFATPPTCVNLAVRGSYEVHDGLGVYHSRGRTHLGVIHELFGLNGLLRSSPSIASRPVVNLPTRAVPQ